MQTSDLLAPVCPQFHGSVPAPCQDPRVSAHALVGSDSPVSQSGTAGALFALSSAFPALPPVGQGCLVFSMEPSLGEGETIPGHLVRPPEALLLVSKQTSQLAFEAASKAAEGLRLWGL